MLYITYQTQVYGPDILGAPKIGTPLIFAFGQKASSYVLSHPNKERNEQEGLLILSQHTI
jgi:hypothetical protein